MICQTSERDRRESERERDEMRANDSCNLEFRRTFEGPELHSWLHLSSVETRERTSKKSIRSHLFPTVPCHSDCDSESKTGGSERREGRRKKKKREKASERKREEKEVGRGNVEGGKINVQTRFRECLRVRFDARDDPEGTTTTTRRRAPR